MTLVDLGVAVLVPATGGLLVWVWSLWQAHHRLALDVATVKGDSGHVARDVADIKRDVREIRALVDRLCLKLHVPAVTDDYT